MSNSSYGEKDTTSEQPVLLEASWPSPPNPDLVEQLRSNASGPFRIVFLAMSEHGVRVNELRRLVWREVDLQKQTFQLRSEGRRILSPRMVPIEAELAGLIADHKRCSIFTEPQQPVFPTVSGRPWAHIRFYREWESLCRLVLAEYDVPMPGKAYFPLTHLRRNAVRRWRDQGRSYKDICQWMGRYHALTGAFAREDFATR